MRRPSIRTRCFSDPVYDLPLPYHVPRTPCSPRGRAASHELANAETMRFICLTLENPIAYIDLLALFCSIHNKHIHHRRWPRTSNKPESSIQSAPRPANIKGWLSASRLVFCCTRMTLEQLLLISNDNWALVKRVGLLLAPKQLL